MSKYSLEYKAILELREGFHEIGLYTNGSIYFFYQTQQNESEFIFTTDELREMCEQILEYLDSEEK